MEHHDNLIASSLIDVDSGSVHTVPSDFSEESVTTDTQASRIEREEEQAEEQAKEKAAEAKEKAAEAKKEFAEKEQQAKEKAKKVAGKIERNADNPVLIANSIAVVGLSAALGFGAYRKYAAGELTWKVVGAWAGVVGLFAAGNFYVST